MKARDTILYDVHLVTEENIDNPETFPSWFRERIVEIKDNVPNRATLEFERWITFESNILGNKTHNISKNYVVGAWLVKDPYGLISIYEGIPFRNRFEII